MGDGCCQGQFDDVLGAGEYSDWVAGVRYFARWAQCILEQRQDEDPIQIAGLDKYEKC